MPIVSVRIPQIGEGLQEARLVAVLKQPGERVKRDEPIYQMETDKAVMDVESPYDGILTEWLAEPDTVLPIGAAVATMEVEEGVEEVAPAHGAPADGVPAVASGASGPAPAPAAARRLDIPPRTRAYAKEKGLTEADLEKIPAAGSRLMPSDIDAYLAGAGEKGYDEAPMSQKQRVLASRLQRGTQLVVPGTISVVCDWEPIEALRQAYKERGGDFQPSTFTMFAYAVTRASVDFPIVRTTLVGDGTLRTYRHLHLGIAVALPGDELVLAVIPEACRLDWPAFAQAARAQIELARQGQDQANEAVTLSLTNMQAYGLRDAVPVVVPPAMGTLFLGEVYRGLDPQSEEPRTKRLANIAFTFDHRLLNGVGAAEFVQAVKRNVETIGQLIPAP